MAQQFEVDELLTADTTMSEEKADQHLSPSKISRDTMYHAPDEHQFKQLASSVGRSF